MKRITILTTIVCTTLLILSFNTIKNKNLTNEWAGAWRITNGTTEELLLIADNYCMVTKYDKVNKQFIETHGGPLTNKEGKTEWLVHFYTNNASEVGKTYPITYTITGNTLSITRNGKEKKWERADNGNSELFGNWRITQRKENGNMNEIPLRARRTLKLLTGNHFQWAAINIETGEFSGTGGGTYSFKDGKYTEHIEFFSRDNSRVGNSLTFDGNVENGNWIHSGLSSKGDPIYEIWSRLK